MRRYKPRKKHVFCKEVFSILAGSLGAVMVILSFMVSHGCQKSTILVFLISYSVLVASVCLYMKVQKFRARKELEGLLEIRQSRKQNQA